MALFTVVYTSLARVRSLRCATLGYIKLRSHSLCVDTLFTENVNLTYSRSYIVSQVYSRDLEDAKSGQGSCSQHSGLSSGFSRSQSAV